jgi:hypothetical protein
MMDGLFAWLSLTEMPQMTTAVFDRRTHTIGADTQNTTPDGGIVRTSKVERLANGWYFLGSGHCYTIGLCRGWAAANFEFEATPDWELFLEDVDEYGFACIAVNPKTWEVYVIDNEMVPNKVLDAYVAIGSGGPYALGAMDAGATVIEALHIAANRDPNSSAPFEVISLNG